MDFWKVIRTRHSVRAYDSTADVSPDQITQILEAAIEAPSGGNCQPWHFVVVRDPAFRKGLAHAAYEQQCIVQAPVIIVVCTDAARSAQRYGRRGTELYCLQDTAAATMHILLAATALELGSCWVGAFDEAKAARALDLPGYLRPVAMVALGHASGPSSRDTSRRPLEEVVSRC